MNRIEHEIRRLIEMATSGELPGYPAGYTECSFFQEKNDIVNMVEHYSEENNALEREMGEMWKNDPQKRNCIPVVLAALERSKEHENHVVVQTELYNYTM